MIPGDRVEVRLPARAEYLALARTVVTTLAEARHDLDPARLDDLRLAVSEAVANAVEAYHRIGCPGAEVVLRVTVDEKLLAVEVEDRAGGFDPHALVPHPPVDTPERLHHERGLGLPLMRQLADDFDICFEGGVTNVRLGFRVREAAANG